jgi:hypothetical protein
MKRQGSHSKRKTTLSKKEREAIKVRVKDQLSAIHPKLKRPTDKRDRIAIRRNPELLDPEWNQTITKRL